MKKIISSFILDEHFKFYQLSAIGSVTNKTHESRQIRIIRIDREIIPYRELPETDEKRQMFSIIEQRIMDHLHDALPCYEENVSCDLAHYIPELNFTLDYKIFLPSDNLVYVKLLNRELLIDRISRVLNNDYSELPILRRFNMLRLLQKTSAGIADYFPAALFLADTDMRIIWANTSFYRLFKITDKNNPGDSLYLTDFLDDSYLNILNVKSITDNSRVLEQINLLMQYKNTEHRKFWGETRMTYETDSDMHFGIITEISSSRKTAISNPALKLIDNLTGLPGREFFTKLLTSEIEKSAAAGRNGLTVITILLDGLGRINAFHGRDTGDALVKSLSVKILDMLNVKRDTIARTESDRFTIILPDIDNETSAAEFIRRMKQVVDRKHFINGQKISCPVYFGAAVYPLHGKDASELINKTEKIIYHNKDSQQQISGFLKPETGIPVKNSAAVDTAVTDAILNNEFIVHYQALVKNDQTISGLEALVRWDNPVSGFMYPKDFINAAEHSGAIFDIGLFVLRESCALIKKCIEKNLPAPRVSINLSPCQFNHPGLVSSITGILDEEKVPYSGVEFEITESCIIGNEDAAIRKLTELKEAGISVSLDDFGTGYSLLARLHRFPLSSIKIDRTFIYDSMKHARSRVIMKHIVDLSHDLNLAVVAEGVEDPEQFQFLQKRKFDLFQGYLFGHPVPGDEAIKALSGKTS